MFRKLIDQYGLLPHPEGGYYKETYRSTEGIQPNGLPSRFNGPRNFSTAIFFLLLKESFSAFHRIASDECWHFYEGDSLAVHVIHTTGEYELIRLGPDFSKGEVYQAVVPAGSWFASECLGKYSFVGCTVAPGFDFEDFELAGKSLAAEFPQYEELILRLVR